MNPYKCWTNKSEPGSHAPNAHHIDNKDDQSAAHCFDQSLLLCVSVWLRCGRTEYFRRIHKLWWSNIYYKCLIWSITQSHHLLFSGRKRIDSHKTYESTPKNPRHCPNSRLLWMNMHQITVCVSLCSKILRRFSPKSTDTLWYNLLMNRIRTFVVLLKWVWIPWKPFDFFLFRFDFSYYFFASANNEMVRGTKPNWNLSTHSVLLH